MTPPITHKEHITPSLKIALDASDKKKALTDEETMEEPHVKGKMVNYFLVILAFGVLLGYLIFAGEGQDLLEAVSKMNWWFLLLSICMVVLYWFFEAGCMQIFSNSMWKGFSYKKTVITSIIGQYFNCVTPLSSGGQPFQAYYYSRFGMPLSKSMPMLLCRFITYQITTTIFCAIVLILRFNYFSKDYPHLMVLVGIGFVGGLILLLCLLALAFLRKPTMKAVRFGLKIGNKLHLVRNYNVTLHKAAVTLNDAYKEVHFLLREPKMLFKSMGLTLVQLLEYFSISFVIACGLGVDSPDFLTIISCQAFVYMISSFIPTPGAMGAAETSYALFFSNIYANASLVALSTFIWRLLTFYMPIVVGMVLTLIVNKKNTTE